MVSKPRARGHSKAALLAAAVLALAAALASVGRSPGVLGLLADQEVAVGTFEAAQITDIALVLPGKATAGAFNEGSPEPVARAGPDGLVRELDFGTNNVDSGRNFPDVVRIVNVSGGSIAVEWRYEGEIAACFRETAGALELAPGGVASLGSQLVHWGVNPGPYDGVLVIGVSGYSYRLPARVTLVEPPPENHGAGPRSQAPQSEAAGGPADMGAGGGAGVAGSVSNQDVSNGTAEPQGAGGSSGGAGSGPGAQDAGGLQGSAAGGGGAAGGQGPPGESGNTSPGADGDTGSSAVPAGGDGSAPGTGEALPDGGGQAGTGSGGGAAGLEPASSSEVDAGAGS